MSLVRVNEATQDDAEDLPLVRRRGSKWTTTQNLVLLSGWIKCRTNSIVGRNQKK
ncbi:hypothetical protein AALP_AA2G098400 [Arabis alpina]|uniref:Uncharacterized protein n=1 Tax=Arabis alpina TaxID=50452 RepID=A0A087HGE8_ARAAL|nr:hypothetical protein AALP_AA2G098400 [Arabis alpina]